MRKRISLIGKTFWRWTVISDGAPGKNGEARSICVCTCGNTRLVWNQNLVTGKSRSCGCFSREQTSKTKKIHGMRHTPEYNVWSLMHRRCYSTTSHDYARWGARGITVDERWHSFTNFYNDMGARPTAQHSIERKDNNGNYTPDNCVWALPTEQSRNRRSNRLITYNGVTLCLTDLAAVYGKTYGQVRDRLANGWGLEKALATPIRAGNYHRKKPIIIT